MSATLEILPADEFFPIERTIAHWPDGKTEDCCKDTGLPESECSCYGTWPDGTAICRQRWSEWL